MMDKRFKTKFAEFMAKELERESLTRVISKYWLLGLKSLLDLAVEQR